MRDLSEKPTNEKQPTREVKINSDWPIRVLHDFSKKLTIEIHLNQWEGGIDSVGPIREQLKVCPKNQPVRIIKSNSEGRMNSNWPIIFVQETNEKE